MGVGGPQRFGGGAARDDLAVAILWEPDAVEGAAAPPGSWRAWVLPADHDGTGLPTDPGARPLLLALRPPDSWMLRLPPTEQRITVFLEGAERLARALRPRVLLPFPEPDGEAEASWLFGVALDETRWHELLREARRPCRSGERRDT